MLRPRGKGIRWVYKRGPCFPGLLTIPAPFRSSLVSDGLRWWPCPPASLSMHWRAE